jgi:predicted MPP superfamily phosphohydrolase
VLVKLLRAVPPALVLICGQVGLYLVLRELFAPLPEQARRRRHIVLAQVLLGAWLPVFFLLGKAGVALPAPLRWLAQPLLAYHMLSLPALLLLGAALSVAHRVHRRGRSAAPVVLSSAAGALAVPDENEAAPDPVDPFAPLPEGRRVFLARAATGLFAGAGALAAAGIHSAEAQPLLSRHDVALPGLHPDLDGLTIVQLSDVHAGMLMTEERMAEIARHAAALQPDVVVLTGDLLDMSRKAGPPFARAFSGLHGKLGTFAILGNHDYYAGAGAAVAAVQDAGGVLLRNDGRRLERGKGSLWIGGTDDPACISLGRSVDPQRALRGAAPGEPRVLLAHRPSLFHECAGAGAQLVLSGHTHGGQVALSPRWSLARAIGPYTMGFYRRGDAQLFVHRGLGVVAGMPLRLGSRPEIALLTLRRS